MKCQICKENSITPYIKDEYGICMEIECLINSESILYRMCKDNTCNVVRGLLELYQEHVDHELISKNEYKELVQKITYTNYDIVYSLLKRYLIFIDTYIETKEISSIQHLRWLDHIPKTLSPFHYFYLVTDNFIEEVKNRLENNNFKSDQDIIYAIRTHYNTLEDYFQNNMILVFKDDIREKNNE